MNKGTALRGVAAVMCLCMMLTALIGCNKTPDPLSEYSYWYSMVPVYSYPDKDSDPDSSDAPGSSDAEPSSDDVSATAPTTSTALDPVRPNVTGNATGDNDEDKNYTETAAGRIYPVERFGAVGDGKTDDGVAVNDAIQEARLYTAANSGKTAVVKFQAGKTYVLKTQNFAGSSSGASLALRNAKNVTLEGSNTTIIGRPDWRYLLVEGSANVTVTGMNFTYDTPVAYRAKVTAREGSVVTFEVPDWFNACVIKNTLSSSAFAIPANGRRDHSWITSIRKVDATHCKVAFSTGANVMEVGSYVDLPTPGYGHVGTAFSILGNNGLVQLDHINVWNAGQFVFQVNRNALGAEIRFDHVTLAPKDANDCPTVAWRDCIHAKDNRAKLTINQCTFGNTHDDIFNISNTMLRVDNLFSPTDIRLYGLDYGGAYVGLQEGDHVVAINPVTDKYYGETTIREVKSQGNNTRVVLDRDLGLETGAYLYVKEQACPGTTITGGTYSGSVRIRATGTKITGATFNLLAMWTAYEGNNGSIEGPIPSDILYKSCTFNPYSENAVGGFDFTCRLVGAGLPAATAYKTKNIIFEGCTFNGCKLPDNDPAVVVR